MRLRYPQSGRELFLKEKIHKRWNKGRGRRVFQYPIPNAQYPLLQKPNHVQETVTGNQLDD
jgi:hypothetical protein